MYPQKFKNEMISCHWLVFRGIEINESFKAASFTATIE